MFASQKIKGLWGRLQALLEQKLGEPLVAPPARGEDDETVLGYIEMLKTVDDERSREVALSGLMDLVGDEVEKHLRSYQTRLYNLDPDFIDDVRDQIWMAIQKEITLGRYDPSRMKFREFVGRMAHTIVGRQAAKGVEVKKKEKIIARISPETEDVIKAKEVRHSAQLSPEEVLMGQKIKEYLQDIEKGRKPFPYRVRIPPGSPPEARARREAMILDMFSSFYGFGKKRVTFRELKEKYGTPEEPDDRFKKRIDETFGVMKSKLADWVRRNEGEFRRLGIEEPLKTYYSLWSKMPDLIMRRPGIAPIFERLEESLLTVFDVVRCWGGPSF